MLWPVLLHWLETVSSKLNRTIKDELGKRLEFSGMQTQRKIRFKDWVVAVEKMDKGKFQSQKYTNIKMPCIQGLETFKTITINWLPVNIHMGFPCGWGGKESACNVGEIQVWSLGGEDPLEKGMATNSSILAWRIPWTEEPGGLQSMRSQRVRHEWATHTHTHTHKHTCNQRNA